MSKLVLLAAALLLPATSAQALTIYSAFADFSTVANDDTTRWSYRSSPDAVHDGSYPLLTSFGQPLPTFWSPAQSTWFGSGLAPGVGRNDTGGVILGLSGSAQFSWPDGEMWLHPDTSGLAVVSWLSPSHGVADVAFFFADMDGSADSLTHPASNGIHWAVDRNAATLASGTLANNGSSGAQQLLGVTVAPGDRIHFIVDANGFFQFDSTRFAATIEFEETVAEPVGLAAAALATLVAAARARRRR